MIIDFVFSKHQTIATCSILDLTAMVNEGQAILRDVNKIHVREIKNYIIENIFQEQIYFPAIIANVSPGSFLKGRAENLTIIDGNKRLKAFCSIEDFAYRTMRSDKEIESFCGEKILQFLKKTELSVLLFEGLSKNEMDQLYIDFNRHGHKVALVKRITMDTRNILNQITTKVLDTNEQLKLAGVEVEKSAVKRPRNKKLLSLSQLRQITVIFLSGKMVYRIVNQIHNPYLGTNEYVNLINEWFAELFKLYPPEKIGDFSQSMLTDPILLYSLAYYANRNLEKTPFTERMQQLRSRMEKLAGINWSRTNPVWQNFKRENRQGFCFLYKDKATVENLLKWLQQQGR